MKAVAWGSALGPLLLNISVKNLEEAMDHIVIRTVDNTKLGVMPPYLNFSN